MRGDGVCDTMSEASDVLLCDYSSFLELTGSRKNACEHGKSRRGCSSDSTNFESLILDLRHPLNACCHRSNKTDEKRFTETDDARNGPETTSQSEIDSIKWWNFLNKFIMTFSIMKRLIIEQADLPQNQFAPWDLNRITHGSQIDEMLAMRVAFIYHPSIFFFATCINWKKSYFVGQTPACPNRKWR